MVVSAQTVQPVRVDDESAYQRIEEPAVIAMFDGPTVPDQHWPG